jgi:hypothetical protein
MNFYTSLGWTIKDRRCVELIKCFPFDYTYAFFGVRINKLSCALSCLLPQNLIPLSREPPNLSRTGEKQEKIGGWRREERERVRS